MNVIDSAQIHSLIRQHYRELQPDEPPTGNLNEEFLTDGSHEIARSYRVGNVIAMWHIDAGLLQFFDLQANLLRSVPCP